MIVVRSSIRTRPLIFVSQHAWSYCSLGRLCDEVCGCTISAVARRPDSTAAPDGRAALPSRRFTRLEPPSARSRPAISRAARRRRIGRFRIPDSTRTSFTAATGVRQCSRSHAQSLQQRLAIGRRVADVRLRIPDSTRRLNRTRAG